MKQDLFLPKHVAIIMDGNRRWARKNRLPSFEGHRRGEEKIEPIIDMAIEGFNQKLNVSIISKESDIIQRFIVEKLERGATIYTAKGAYTMRDKEIVTSVMDKKEFISLKGYVKSVDPNAFLMVSNVREVLGEGFYR